jgi:hypothetical protein
VGYLSCPKPYSGKYGQFDVVVTNPNWQAFIFSPLAGVVFSMLLSPSVASANNTVAVNSYNNYNSHNHINSHNTVNVYADNSTNSTGDFTMMFAVAGPAAYLHYAPLALHWIVVVSMFIVAMSVVLFVRSCTTGAISEGAWILRILVPSLIAVAAYCISGMALEAYYYPSGSGWEWTIMQAVAVTCLCLSMLVATLSLINSTALLRVPDPEHVGASRAWVLQATRRYARPASLIVAIVFTVAAPLLINGQAMAWMHSTMGG